MVKGIYAVLLKTTNIERLKDFYVKKLGLKAAHSCQTCAVLELGGQRLTMQANPQAKTDLGETAPVSFGLSVGDVSGLHKSLAKDGVRFSAAPKQEEWGATTASLLDPDGNRVTLIQEGTGPSKGTPCVAMKGESTQPTKAAAANPGPAGAPAKVEGAAEPAAPAKPAGKKKA